MIAPNFIDEINLSMARDRQNSRRITRVRQIEELLETLKDRNGVPLTDKQITGYKIEREVLASRIKQPKQIQISYHE